MDYAEITKKETIKAWNTFIDAIMRLTPDPKDDVMARIEAAERKSKDQKELESNIDKILSK